MAAYAQFWKVRSDSDPEKFYTVGRTSEGSFGCNCIGWCRHVPRRDCRHITYVRAGHAEVYDPLLRSMSLTVRAQERKETKRTNESEQN